MHENFRRAESTYYAELSERVKDRLRGPITPGFVDVAGFTLANPAFIVAGRHTLTHKGLAPNIEGKLVEQTHNGASQPFAVLFSTAVFGPRGIDTYVTGVTTVNNKTFLTDDLGAKSRIGRDIPPEGLALLGVTFSTVKQEDQERFDQQVAKIQPQLGVEGDPRSPALQITPSSPLPFAAYGYAALLISPGKGSPTPEMRVRFFGTAGTYSHPNLVLPDGKPIDVTLTDASNRERPVQNVGDFSLAPYTGFQTTFDRSDPRQYVGPLHVVNEVVDRRDARGYAPELTFAAIEEVLRSGTAPQA